MTATSWVLLGLAAVAAVSDWVGVGERWKGVEYLSKPLAMVALIGVALAMHPENADVRPWIVAALVFSLAGDVFLMVPGDLFVFGLSSFLLAHVAYVVAFRVEGGSAAALAVSAVVVAAAIVVIARRVLAGVKGGEPALVGPVVAYVAVIGAMGACALATGNPLFAAGAVLFMTSDSLIAWNRFVQPLSWAPLAIIVTYHLAQALLVTGMST
jgi:uncharacterized membrane protein YhhN